jgi:hypothetical protein
MLASTGFNFLSIKNHPVGVLSEINLLKVEKFTWGLLAVIK